MLHHCQHSTPLPAHHPARLLHFITLSTLSHLLTMPACHTPASPSPWRIHTFLPCQPCHTLSSCQYVISCKHFIPRPVCHPARLLHILTLPAVLYLSYLASLPHLLNMSTVPHLLTLPACPITASISHPCQPSPSQTATLYHPVNLATLANHASMSHPCQPITLADLHLLTLPTLPHILILTVCHITASISLPMPACHHTSLPLLLTLSTLPHLLTM